MIDDCIIGVGVICEDDIIDVSICFKCMVDYFGQVFVCEQLLIYIDVVKGCGDVFDYVLIFGLFGLGKIILSYVIVNELGVVLWVMLGLVIEKVGDLVVLLINLQLYDVLFIDEIYCLLFVVEEVLYLVMEDFQIDIMIGEGFVVCLIKIDLLLFILIGVIMWVGLLIVLLCDCFGIVYWLEFYMFEELIWIVCCLVVIFNIDCIVEGVVEIVWCLCGILCIVNWLLCWVCDYVQVKVVGYIDQVVVQVVMQMLKVDLEGFDDFDWCLFRMMVDYFDGGLVGIELLVVVLFEECGILEDVVEFYLIQQGFLICIVCGCMCMYKVYWYMGLKLKNFFVDLFVEVFDVGQFWVQLVDMYLLGRY